MLVHLKSIPINKLLRLFLTINALKAYKIIIDFLTSGSPINAIAKDTFLFIPSERVFTNSFFFCCKLRSLSNFEPFDFAFFKDNPLS